MLVCCVDEDFDGRILAGVRRRWNEFSYERVVDAGLGGRPDSDVLEWAARSGRVLLTQDARTMPAHALDRVRRGLPMPGVIVVPQSLPLARAIAELELVLRVSSANDLAERVFRLPI